MKKIIAVVLMFVIMCGVMCGCSTQEITKLSDLDPEQCVAFLKEHNVEIPEGMTAEEIAEMVKQLEIDPELENKLGELGTEAFTELSGSISGIIQEIESNPELMEQFSNLFYTVMNIAKQFCEIVFEVVQNLM